MSDRNKTMLHFVAGRNIDLIALTLDYSGENNILQLGQTEINM